MTRPTARGLLGGLVAATAFLLACVNLQDTDAWTHLALGRGLLQTGGFPATEPFIVAGRGLPYYNPEWLFGLVLYAVWTSAGVAGVVVLKAAIVALAFLVLFRDALLPEDERARTLGTAVTALALIPFMLVVRHRFVERPDIVLMLFLALTIHALHLWVHRGHRLIYVLPALQLVWVNVHPSVLAGFVPYVAFLAGGALQRVLEQRWNVTLPGTPSRPQLRAIALVFLGVGLVSLLNPHGVDVFAAPFRLVGIAWYRDEIQELARPRLGVETAPFVIVALLALAFVLTLRRLSIVSLLLVLPFAYLGLSARRFVFLFAVIAAPILTRHLREVVARLPRRPIARLTPAAAGLAVVAAVTVGAAAVARIPPLADAHQVPGFGVNLAPVPEGALRYLDRAGVDGHVFNTFHWGGYVIWRDFPRRAPIFDGRGHLPPAVLDQIAVARTSPLELERLRARLGFDVAVVDYPGRAPLGDQMPAIDFAWTSEQWALVYWDDLALVYLRRGGRHAALVERDEYRHVRPANGPWDLRRRLREGPGFAAIERELERNVEQTDSAAGWALLGFLYNEVGLHDRAIAALGRVRDVRLSATLVQAWRGLAFAHARAGNHALAIGYAERVLDVVEDPEVLYTLGVARSRSGDTTGAISALERAIERDTRLVDAYPALVAAYLKAGDRERARRLESAFPRARVMQQAEERFRVGVRLYLEGKHHEAIAALQASLDLDAASAAALSNLGYIYYDLGRLEEAGLRHRQALAVDPDFANAHYGLAMVHERRGEREQARARFAQYLRLEPRGYWARRAREALER